jgi:RNA polymerase sigma-70 factor (ECF subfamily)
VAIRAAFAELERRLARAREKLRPQDSRHPVRVPAAARAEEASRANGRLRRDALHALDEQRQPLQDFVRRELAYHTSLGELPPGRLSVDDVIQAVILRAEQERTDSRRDARGWLTGLALNVVDAALAEGRSRGRAVPSPDEILERADMYDDIARTLGTLPRAWRRVFVLHAVEGLTLREVARILGRSRASVDADLNHAREYLRQRLVDAGFAADERRTQAFFATVPIS